MHTFVESLEARQLMAAAGSTYFVNQTSFGSGRLVTGTVAGRGGVFLDDGKGNSVRAVQLGGIKVSHTGTLFVTGTGKADHIDLTISRGKLAFNPYYAQVPVTGQVVRQSNGTIVFQGSTAGGVQIVIGPRTGQAIKRVVVVGLGGDDTIKIIADVPVDVRGGTGNDTIAVGAPTRTLVGGSGADTVLNIYTGSATAADVHLVDVTKRDGDDVRVLPA